MKEDTDPDWERLQRELMDEMHAWRIQHPRATMSEIERALDERLRRLRARLLEDAARAGQPGDTPHEVR